jgi:hypothetical protein
LDMVFSSFYFVCLVGEKASLDTLYSVAPELCTIRFDNPVLT